MSKVWKTIFIFLVLINLLVFVAIFRHDDNLHLVFCDVGQGDGILIYKKNIQVIVDGGPDRKILSCLGRHMSFFDRTIEYIVLTNSDLDHYGGLIDVFGRFRVLGYGTSGVQKNDNGYFELLKNINQEGLKPTNIYSGNIIDIKNSLKFKVVWPAVASGCGGQAPYLEGKEVNLCSIVLELQYNKFRVLLTGDIVPPATDEMSETISKVDILKVPHHGSKNGLTEALAVKSMPSLAVISDGKDNKFGHPHKETLEILEKLKIKILRTDQVGDIEIVTDGDRWWLK